MPKKTIYILVRDYIGTAPAKSYIHVRKRQLSQKGMKNVFKACMQVRDAGSDKIVSPTWVAGLYTFIPKILISEYFERPWDGNFRCISRPFGILCSF
jgi:hypothetical protein